MISNDYSQQYRFSHREYEMRGFLIGCINSFLDKYRDVETQSNIRSVHLIRHDSFVKALSTTLTFGDSLVFDVMPYEIDQLCTMILNSPTPESECIKWLNAHINKFHPSSPLLRIAECPLNRTGILGKTPASKMSPNDLIQAVQNNLHTMLQNYSIVKIEEALLESFTHSYQGTLFKLGGKNQFHNFLQRTVEHHIIYSIIDDTQNYCRDTFSERAVPNLAQSITEYESDKELFHNIVMQACDDIQQAAISDWNVTEYSFDNWLSGNDLSDTKTVNSFIRSCCFSLIQTGFDLAKAPDKKPADLFVKNMFSY